MIRIERKRLGGYQVFREVRTFGSVNTIEYIGEFYPYKIGRGYAFLAQSDAWFSLADLEELLQKLREVNEKFNKGEQNLL